MIDLISRADAIEAVRKELVCDGRHEAHDKTCRFIADVLLSALPSAEAVQIHNDGTLEVKVPNAQKVGRVLVMDTDSHIGGGLFYPDDAVQGFRGGKIPPKEMLDGTVLIPKHQWLEMERELAKHAEAGQEWIPCSERLPSDKAFVLVTTNDEFWSAKNSEVKIAECFYGGDYWLDRDNRLVDEVLAWMPLPKPYKGGGSE